ncbi:MAG TPA: alpha-2-macroglobulin family protein [Verrucomicrobiae bacterium]
MKQILTLALLAALNFSLAASPRDTLWRQVEDARQHALPKTAITNLEQIVTGALKDKAYAEAAKAIAEKIEQEGNIQGGKPEEKITRLEAELPRAPKEMQPALEAVLAHWYWQYFEQNNWRFMQRTATAQAPGKDFTSWDLPRLFTEIDRHFQRALAADKSLKATPISAWDDFLDKGSMPDSYRPTLYDFIAHEALWFYTSGEQAGAAPENGFELRADSAIFGTSGEFLNWVDHLDASANAPEAKALQLYRDLLRFHQNDPAPRTAFAADDLERLAWGWNAAFGEDKNARYKSALETFIRDWADSDICALALESEGGVLQQEGDLLAARDLAARGEKLFPQSPGGQLCHNLIADIEAKSVSINTERIWNAPRPKISIQYKNLNTVYFRAIPVDWETFLQRQYPRPENLDEKQRRELLAKTPALKWSATLPPTTDFKETNFEAGAPENLKQGYYFIAASANENFGESNNIISMAGIWVSDLALITRNRAGRIEGFVLQANSGEPVSGAEVSVWHLDNNGNRLADPKLKTDANGFFSMKPDQNRGYLFRARHGEDEIASAQDIWWYQWGQPEEPRPRASTVFFTDRAIYRPGQIIQYKGICLWAGQAKNNYEVLKGEDVTVVFHDVNGKEIGRQKQRANDYGSFAGSFTAPRDRLMGLMSLQAEGRAGGVAQFRVEEYKRPKFQAALDAPSTAAKLNEKTVVTGHAMSYTGAAVDGAEVKYRVTRGANVPWWWRWWFAADQFQTQEIAHGSARTQTDGSFKIEFTAQPNPRFLEKYEPTFSFHITADVTDNAGETRSAEHDIRIGYTALEATMSDDEWQTEEKPVELNIHTATLDGEAQTAEGIVKVYELQPPEKVHRPNLAEGYYYWPRPAGWGKDDLSDPNNWPLGKVAAEHAFTTDTNGTAKLLFALSAGAYRAVLETQDRFGKRVTTRQAIQVVQPNAQKLAIKIPDLLAAPNWEAQPGDEFSALWGTGYDEGRAFVEIEHRNKIIQRFWTEPGRTQQQIKIAVTAAMRGGLTLHVTRVRENRAWMESRRISVPWKEKELTVKWEHFTSKLQPGQKETWSALITGPKAEHATAEMVAALYDESLDAFAPQAWQRAFGVFYEDNSSAQPQFMNFTLPLNQYLGSWNNTMLGVTINYRHFPYDVVNPWWPRSTFALHQGFGGIRYANRTIATGGFGGGGVQGMALEREMMPAAAAAPMGGAKRAPASFAFDSLDVEKDKAERPGATPAVDLSKISARKNLGETAFFYPQLMSDSNGDVRMTFTMPEALTKWHFLAFAHDQKLRAGFLEGHAFTAKDLMAQPNPPRFLREGDIVEFTVKVSNQSDKRQTGRVRLNFGDMTSGAPADKLLGNTKPEQLFDIPAKESRGFSWRIAAPDGAPFLSYKAVAATDACSDGEEGALPVLSRRVLVTESLPLPIRGPASKKFEFQPLIDSHKSRTLRNQSLTLQMVSNPAWYAVMALPYLMEFPYECSEQTFNRYYANSLARHIATRDPKIRAIFDRWKNTPALDSPLEKNQDLKSVMLEETPWVQQAQAESQARRNAGILFDDNRLDYEMSATLGKLTGQQLDDGRWPWFPGGPGSDYITLYIVTGFGRLRHLGVDVSMAPAERALQRLDEWMNENYESIQKNMPHPEDYTPSATDALYLYGRSFFLTGHPIAPPQQKAVEFFLRQSRKYGLEIGCRQSQGQIALALKRWGGGGNLETARAIMRSIKERSVSSGELGMFWRDEEVSWWWYRAPIETQALMIEAFDEVMNDQPAVEDCRVWLLKQKQTQDWKTTKATADAIYALLLRGTDLLASAQLVDVTMGGKDVTPKTAAKTEPGTGFYEVRFAPADIKPKLGEITVKKTDPGAAWGSAHWQYMENIEKVKPYEGTPLHLTKTLFTKANTARGPVLSPVKSPLAVGDELVTRLELRVDRDMEFVHLKDQRGSGTEPVSVLSQYKYQDGLAYYESTRDTASHFFIDYLPKGTYVFEYSSRVQLRGRYEDGVAEIQCMYAPEFNSHSGSVELVVK